MICSFYKNGQVLVGIDDKNHPDLLFSRDVDFDKRIEKVEFDVETDKVTVVEIPGAKRNLIFNQLVTGETDDLHGFEFSDIEIGDIITARVFAGNGYAQVVLQAKATEAMFRKMAGQGTQEDDLIITKKNLVIQEVNRVRAIFSLPPM